MNKLVIFVFAGRRENLTIQRPFIDAILDEHPAAEYHLWDLTRTPEDADYVRAQPATRTDGRIKVHTQLHPGHPVQCTATQGRRRGCTCLIHRPPYNEPYAHYAADKAYRNATFLKIDDDVLFLETKRLDDLLHPLQDHPNAVVSANVVNNAVCAKHDPALGPLVAKQYGIDRTRPADDRAWWSLHIDPAFARLAHDWFLNDLAKLTSIRRKVTWTRSRPGEKVSINAIAFRHHTMQLIHEMTQREPKLGDEGAVDRLLPRIATTFRVAHLTFGPQDKTIPPAELNALRDRYAIAAKEYLA